MRDLVILDYSILLPTADLETVVGVPIPVRRVVELKK